MKPYRFTLADDDPDALFLLHRMLARVYPESHISTFSAAEDALTHILDIGTDILITNHGMGQMSGTELIRQLRLRKFVLPIIMISGSPEAKQEALAAGATEFLEKGLPSRVFEAHIRALVELLRTPAFQPVPGITEPPPKTQRLRPAHKASKH